MHFQFVPMEEAYVEKMIAEWKYVGEYAIYDYCNEADHLRDCSIWGNGLFAVLNEKNELIGEVTIEFYEGEFEYLDNALILTQPDYPATMGIGFGMRPDLTGHGWGEEFVRACVQFACDYYQYRGKIMLGVARFNQRAYKVYERVGFKTTEMISHELNGQNYEVIRMCKTVES